MTKEDIKDGQRIKYIQKEYYPELLGKIATITASTMWRDFGYAFRIRWDDVSGPTEWVYDGAEKRFEVYIPDDLS